MTDPLTRCWLDTCREVGHVVLYATSDRLAGLQTRPRQPIVLCLQHGSQVYDVIRAWRKGDYPSVDSGNAKRRRSAPCPNWLVSDLRNGRLPRTSPDPAGWAAASPMATTRPKKADHARR